VREKINPEEVVVEEEMASKSMLRFIMEGTKQSVDLELDEETTVIITEKIGSSLDELNLRKELV
jgi:hypothetical protein